MAIRDKGILVLCLIVILALGCLGGMYLNHAEESNGINSNYFRGVEF